MTLQGYSASHDGQLPLHRHVWPQADGQEMAHFRRGMDSRMKQDISAIQGESFGHRYVEEILGYKTIFHGDEKSIDQGLDGLYYDAKTDAVIVVEFKGQNSPESTLQKNHDWSVTTCQKIIQGNRPYTQVSDYERSMAKLLLEQVDRGRSVRYEVVRTRVQEGRGQIYTQLEKQTYLEQDLAPSQAINQSFVARNQGRDLEYGQTL